MSKLVSIVIPCYNSINFVEEAIASAFAQTYRPIEVIVVDDGSTDGSYDYLLRLQKEKYPELQVYCHPERVNLGVSTTRFKGVLESAGEYIAFLDADDQFVPDKILRQAAMLDEYPAAILCHTSATVIGDTSDAQTYEQGFATHPPGLYHYRKRKDLLQRNGICNSSTLIHKFYLQKVNFAIPQLFQYEDFLCWILLSGHGKFAYLDEPMTLYRVHPNSATASVNKNWLRHYYSSLEMKLALAVKSNSIFLSFRCLISSCITVIVLLFKYSEAESPCFISKDNLPKKLLHGLRRIAKFLKLT